MTDSRPEITVKADGHQVVLGLTFCSASHTVWEMPLSVDDAFALQCRLAAAVEQALIATTRANTLDGANVLPAVKPETWHDREPML